MSSNPSLRRNSRLSLSSRDSKDSQKKNANKEKLSLIKMLTPETKHRSSLKNLNEASKLAEVREEEIVMAVPLDNSYKSGTNNPKRLRRRKENLRATLMLITVCILFLVSEFPQFVLIILSLINDGFYRNLYVPLGDLIDIIVLTNSSINFLLYCSMSKTFRKTFCSYFSFFKFSYSNQND